MEERLPSIAGYPVRDEVADRDEGEVLDGGEFRQFLVPGHAPVGQDDFADRGRAGQARQPGKLGRRLGVALALQHAAAGGPDREDVAGAGQIVRLRSRVGERLNGPGPLGRRNAGRRAVP